MPSRTGPVAGRFVLLLALVVLGWNARDLADHFLGPPRRSGGNTVEAVPWSRVMAYAPVQTTEAPVPARFSAPVATGPPGTDGEGGADEAAWPSTAPPRTWVGHRLCAADNDMWARVKHAVDAAPSERAAQHATAQLGALVAACGEAACAQAVARVRATQDQGRVHQVALRGLLACPGADVRALLDRDVVPDALVLDWAVRTAGKDADAWPRLFHALDRALAAGDLGQVRLAAILVGDHNGPEGARRLLQLRASTPEPLKYALAMGLVRSSDSGAQEEGRRACQANPRDPVCRPMAPLPAPAPPTVADVADSPSVAAEVVRANPALRPNVIAALQAHLRGPDPQAHTALRALAGLDRALAVEAARALPAGAAEHGKLRRALELMPDRSTALARVGARGAPCRTTDQDDGRVTLTDWLEACGAAHLFDVETGEFPNEHDGLLLTLAALGTDATWADARFEEVPPAPTDGQAPYTLHAYAWGRKYTTTARNLGDWFDVASVLGLLNAMARDRGLKERWVVLASFGQEALVTAGDEAWLQQMSREGLLDPSLPDGARETGEAFEQEMLQRLQSGGLRLDSP